MGCFKQNAGAKIRMVIAFLTAAFLALIVVPGSVLSQPEINDETSYQIEEQLTSLTSEESRILLELFEQKQFIAAMEKEEDQLELDIAAIRIEIEALDEKIIKEEESLRISSNALKLVLKNYQRRGPGSYIETMLSSENLSDFLRRLNILRDYTRNTGELLKTIKTSRQVLNSEKEKRLHNLINMEEKQQNLADAIQTKEQLISEMEGYLASLKEEKDSYQERLIQMQEEWRFLKQIFPEATRVFSEVIESGDLPSDALSLTFSLFGVRSTLHEQVLNDIILEKANPIEMAFKFEKDRVHVVIPGKNTHLSGTFVIEDGQILRFVAEEGSFYAMTLDTAALLDIFEQGYLELNLKPILEGSLLEKVTIKDGLIEMNIRLNLF